jgi:hypothetical protein
LLPHVEGVTAVQFPGLVGDDGGQRWPAMWSRAAGKSEAEWRATGKKRWRRGKGKGREPSLASDKVRPGMGSGDDQRLHALHRG